MRRRLPFCPQIELLALLVALGSGCGSEMPPEAPQCDGLGQPCGGDFGSCCENLDCTSPGSSKTCSLRPDQCLDACQNGYDSCAAAHQQDPDFSSQLQTCQNEEKLCEVTCT
jgi:hypothetical protein